MPQKIDMNSASFSKNIILTGAGFTKNFGGHLADEMWALIFNHPKINQHSLIKELMLDDFDYESIYHRVLWEPTGKLYNKEDREAMKNAVVEAYRELDNSILTTGDSYTANLYRVNKLIERFFSDSDNKKINCFFTLNQDLFIERKYSSYGKPLTLPGVKINLGSSLWKQQPLSNNDFVDLPNEEEIKKHVSSGLFNNLNYIKLHGSYNWKGPKGLVIGVEKEEQIKSEPLLAWYFDIFEKALAQNGARLLIIGYGFRDKHINRIISDSINNNDLKLYILNPESPLNFKKRLETQGDIGERILQGLTGYFPYSLLQLYPSDQSETSISKFVVNILFSDVQR